MKNAADEVVGPTDKVFAKNYEDFEENWFQTSVLHPGNFRCSEAGTWANALGVAVIDRGADFQILPEEHRNQGYRSHGSAVTDGTDFGTVAPGTTIGSTSKLRLLPVNTATIVAGDKVVV